MFKFWKRSKEAEQNLKELEKEIQKDDQQAKEKREKWQTEFNKFKERHPLGKQFLYLGTRMIIDNITHNRYIGCITIYTSYVNHEGEIKPFELNKELFENIIEGERE